jgi:DNA invertase Pin-like site-specific DNA recombinase
VHVIEVVNWPLTGLPTAMPPSVCDTTDTICRCTSCGAAKANPTKYCVALYARVSTANGHQDPQLQLRELREYVQRRGWMVVDEYVDTMSGSKDSRPALNRLMADASRALFEGVLVWKLDRFGRSLRHLVNALAEFEARGIDFISFRDHLDLSTPSGRLQFAIIGAMAEFERGLIQERVRAGLRNARAKGKKLGRPRVIVDASRIADLRGQGTAQRSLSSLPKNLHDSDTLTA